MEKIKTKFFDGAFINSLKAITFFTKINEIIDWINGQNNTPDYKVYTALLSQSGTSAPTITTTYIDQLGFINTTRSGAGDYYINFTDFDITKTLIPPFSTYSEGGVGLPILNTSTNLISGYYAFYPNSDGSIGMTVVDAETGTNTDLATLIGNTSIYIEIRVYP